jgi:ABC-type multidrug transport system fused ATPase/permease subunit
MPEAGYKKLTAEDPDNGNGTVARNSDSCHLDIVQFAAPIHVVDAAMDDPKVHLAIMRMGSSKGECSVRYRTIDGSAKAGDQFVYTEGSVTLKDGEEGTVITIPILDDPEWNPTMEFQVVLTDPSNCDLGLSLKQARIKVMDASCFPSDAFRENLDQITTGDFNGIGEFRLFFQFCLLCFTVEGVKWKTAVMLFFDQLKNGYAYLRLMLAIYMVDKVFNMDSDEETLLVPGQRAYTAYVVAGLIITPVLIFFALDHLVIRINCSGTLKTWLAKSLFRKYMNYSTESQETIPLSEQVGALSGDVADACEGYSTLISMGRLIGKIGMAIFFTLQQNPDAWWAVVSIPGIMLIWGCCRTRKYITALDDTDDADDDRTTFVNEMLSKLPLVSSYSQRPQINKLFEDKCKELTPKVMFQKQVVLTNKFVPEALGPLMVSIYTAVGAPLVLNNALPLGVYLATISVFGTICGSFTEMFGMVMSIITTFTGLKGLTQHLNMETDLKGMMKSYQTTQDFTAKKCSEITREPGDWIPRVDMLKIEVSQVCFDMQNMLHGLIEGEPPMKNLFKDLNFTTEQGKIIAVTGRSGSGRRTFLEMLAMRRFPDKGTVFIPSHLRCVLISRETYMLNLSLWENLVFGNKESNNPHRVEKILQHLNLTQILSIIKDDLEKRKREFDKAELGQVKEEKEIEEKVEKANPMDKLRESEKAWIHMARGFIMNPEVLVMHRPFANFHGKEHLDKVKQTLQAQRDNRGLLMPPETAWRRRPRTIFFSSDDRDVIRGTADLTWVLPKEPGGKYHQVVVSDAVADDEL